MRTIRKVFVLLVLSVGSVQLYGQDAKVVGAETEDRPCNSTQKTVQLASQTYPPVDEGTVNSDFATIRAAQKKVQKAYAKRGFDDCASKEATVQAWKQMRTDQPHGRLDENALVMLANDGFGGLKISSIPPGAAIKVDGKPWDHPTNTTSWTRVGRRQIVLSINGYADSEGETNVVAGKLVEYRAKLSKKK